MATSRKKTPVNVVLEHHSMEPEIFTRDIHYVLYKFMNCGHRCNHRLLGKALILCKIVNKSMRYFVELSICKSLGFDGENQIVG
jgi:hypothetical protein